MIDPTRLLKMSDADQTCESIAEHVRGKTYHVTGGAGTIGRAVVRALVEYGAAKVYAIDRDEGRLSGDLPHGCERVLGDVAHIYPVSSNADAVIHCAAYKHVDGLQSAPMAAVRNNVEATAIVAEWCRSHDTPMVYLSTDKAINPVGVLGLSKALGEHVARSIAGARIVRLVNVIGSSGSAVERWCESLNNGTLPVVCNPFHERHYVSERYAANVVLSALLAPECCDLIPAWYETITTGDLCGRLLEIYGRGPYDYIQTSDRPGERVTEPVIPDGHHTAEKYGMAVVTCPACVVAVPAA